MQGPGTKCGLSIGFDAFLLSFQANRVLLFRVSPCLFPPGQNLGISNSRDPFVFSTLRQPRCMEWMALVGLMVTLQAF